MEVGQKVNGEDGRTVEMGNLWFVGKIKEKIKKNKQKIKIKLTGKTKQKKQTAFTSFTIIENTISFFNFS